MNITELNFSAPKKKKKKCWVISTQIWVRYGQTQMLGKKMYS